MIRSSSSVLLAAALAVLAAACGGRTPAPAAAPPPAPAAEAAPAASEPPRLAYPATRKGDVVEVLHGETVADPYRWLEDPDSPETRAWVEAQNRLTFSFLEKIPARKAIAARLEQLWRYDRYGVPERAGKRIFYTYATGGQNQRMLVVVDAADGAPRTLLDPNALAPDGTISIKGYAPSPDGSLVAVALSTAGSDWAIWKVVDVSTGKVLPDEVRWSKFSGATWTKDGKGFFYARFPEPKAGTSTAMLLHQKLYYHAIGTEQTADRLIVERPDQPEWMFESDVTDDGRLLVVTVRRSTEPKHLIYVRDLRKRKAELVPLVDEWRNEYTYVGSRGSTLYFITDQAAPRGRIVSIDARRPRRGWRDVLPQGPDAIDQAQVLAGDHLVVGTMKDALSVVTIVGLDGEIRDRVELPGPGSAYGFAGDSRDTETFYAFTSYLTPPRIYRLDVARARSTEFRTPKLAYDPDAYESKQVFYESKDGTRIPMMLSYRKGTKLDGNRPTILFGYGGFQIPMVPSFKAEYLAWMELGGVYAVASLRGGGEYGEDWHQAGMLDRKQNVFDDFVAAAKWLVANGVTKRERLALAGRSNGGLLVGATITQRPDLAAAALPTVGVMDMLRYHKFTIGRAWAGEYGSPDDPAHFKTLLAYSPLHNVRPGTRYPATLATTADHDDRVVPAHSYKFIAGLQGAQAGPAPVLIRVDTKAGHGAGKPVAQLVAEAADQWAFLVHVLGMDVSAASGATGASAGTP